MIYNTYFSIFFFLINPFTQHLHTPQPMTDQPPPAPPAPATRKRTFGVGVDDSATVPHKSWRTHTTGRGVHARQQWSGMGEEGGVPRSGGGGGAGGVSGM